MVRLGGILDLRQQAHREPQRQGLSRFLGRLAGHAEMIADTGDGGNFRDTSSIYDTPYSEVIMKSF
jgi:hypothetical protein